MEWTLVQSIRPRYVVWYIPWHIRDPYSSPWCTTEHAMVYPMAPDVARLDISSIDQITKQNVFSVYTMFEHGTV